MKKHVPTVAIVVLATWIPIAFWSGIVWCLTQTRETPSRVAVRAVNDQIAAYHDEHGSLPASLGFLPASLKRDVARFHMTYDVEELRLRARAGPYYDYSGLYLLTRGIAGRRSEWQNPGWSLEELAQQSPEPAH